MSAAKRKPVPRSRKEPTWRRTNMVHWRKHNGWTLEEVAVELETTHATVSRWENGVHPPSTLELERLAVLYKTDIHSMLNRLPGVPNNGTGDEGAAELGEIYRHLSSRDRKKLLAMVKAAFED